MSKPKISRA